MRLEGGRGQRKQGLGDGDEIRSLDCIPRAKENYRIILYRFNLTFLSFFFFLLAVLHSMWNLFVQGLNLHPCGVQHLNY